MIGPIVREATVPTCSLQCMMYDLTLLLRGIGCFAVLVDERHQDRTSPPCMRGLCDVPLPCLKSLSSLVGCKNTSLFDLLTY